MNVGNRDEILPLTPSEFYTLAALAHGPSYGQEIMDRIGADSGGVIDAASGTIYPLLARMVAGGMAVEVKSGDAGSIKGKKVYQLTGLGRQILIWEMERLEQLVKLGRKRIT